jgi:hypothetical protein
MVVPFIMISSTDGTQGWGVCGAKRIRSIYLPSPTGRPPGLSTTTSFKALASLSTINGAITPWRDVFAEQTPLP